MRSPLFYSVLGALLLTAHGLACIAVGHPEQVGCYADPNEPGCPNDAALSDSADLSSDGETDAADSCQGVSDAECDDGASSEGAESDAGAD